MHMCPTADCGGMVCWSPGDGPPRHSCPVCLKESCLACRQSWHPGRSCEEAASDRAVGTGGSATEDLRRRELEEAATRDMLKRSKIRICCRCGAGVVKSEGCHKMMCRCGYTFCWQCGAP